MLIVSGLYVYFLKGISQHVIFVDVTKKNIFNLISFHIAREILVSHIHLLVS